MVSRGAGNTITSLINGDDLHIWSDYLVEYDQAPQQPDISDLPSARNGILHVAAQLNAIRKGVESAFTSNMELVEKLNRFGTQLDSILADIRCDSGNKFDTVDKEVINIKATTERERDRREERDRERGGQ